MSLSIAQTKGWWKNNEKDLTLGVGVFLLVLTAFFGGRISAISKTAEQIFIEVPDAVLQKQAEMAQSGSLVRLSAPTNEKNVGIPKEERKGEYVASRNGIYYYTADMAAAVRIGVKNRVWFGSQEEAEKKGFKAAKGIQESSSL